MTSKIGIGLLGAAMLYNVVVAKDVNAAFEPQYFVNVGIRFEAEEFIPNLKRPQLMLETGLAEVEQDKVTRQRTFEETITGVNRDGNYTQTGKTKELLSDSVTNIKKGNEAYTVSIRALFDLFEGNNVSVELVSGAGNRTLRVEGGLGYDFANGAYVVGDSRAPFVVLGGKYLLGAPKDKDGKQFVPIIELNTQGPLKKSTKTKYLEDIVNTTYDTTYVTTNPTPVDYTPVDNQTNTCPDGYVFVPGLGCITGTTGGN